MGALFVTSVALATDYGLGTTADAAGLSTGKDITQIIGDVIGTGLSLVSVLFFGLMLYAGIKWMLARGDSGQAEEALGTIIAAVIGLVVVLASYAITNFVFKSVGAGGGGGAPAAAGGGASTGCAAEGTGYACREPNVCDPAKTSTKSGLCGVGLGCCASKAAPAVSKSCKTVLSVCYNLSAPQTNCISGEQSFTKPDCAN